MADRILIVDDEVEIADLIEVYLRNEDYEVLKFYTAKEALACMKNTPVDLAILDVMLPDMSGFTLCQKIRETAVYPVIMLTAKDAETDKITGLTLGADDYITKPFQPLELVARVKSQLRRYKKYNPSQMPQTKHILSCSDLILDTKKHECLLGDKPISLTPTEFSGFANPVGKQRTCCQWGRALLQNMEGRVLHQGRQYNHCPYPAAA